ncbi:MAG: radical SAM protein [Candidatus Aminicenantes bacterium]|jgi:radical SAM superfamily enzyme YgiQ (UPF0313 family)
MDKRFPSIKIILIQLPHPSYLKRNVPLAAGYLKAAAYKNDLLEKVDIEILDPMFMGESGCQKLIGSIIDKNPDILGFSLYLWNVERSFYIIKKIKEKCPHIKIIVGGPEVTRHSTYILSNSNIDIGVIGEGEITFVEIIKHFLNKIPETGHISGIFFRQNGHIVINNPRKRISDIESIPSPYLLGYIDYRKYRDIPIFTMRGCKLRCSYCSWTSRGKLRAFSLERLRQELCLAKESGNQSLISIWDSAFNASPVFYDFCKMAKEINKDKKLVFHCFIQADLIDLETAKLLKESNFLCIETGLQSVNSDVLCNINRTINTNKLIKGINCLRNIGIKVKVDLILGLPGDSLNTFENTMKFIDDNKLDPIIFNLSMGHGAKLSREQERFGAMVQTSPPFYVLENSTFSKEELHYMINRYAWYSADCDRISNLYYPNILSRLKYRFNSNKLLDDIEYDKTTNYPIRNIVVDMDMTCISASASRLNELTNIISQKVSCNLSILCVGKGKNFLNNFWVLEILLNRISEKNPHINWNIFIEAIDYRPDQTLIDEIISFIKKPKIFLDYRDELFPINLPCIRRKSINIFALLPCNKDCEKLNINVSNCIRTVDITYQTGIEDQVKRILSEKGSGFLIDFNPDSKIDFIKEVMSSLLNNISSYQGIFFKDWVLQRLWEQEFLKITSERDDHYELLIDQNMNILGRFFGEYDLIYDAITKWELVKQECHDDNMEQLIMERVLKKLSAKDNIKSNGRY